MSKQNIPCPICGSHDIEDISPTQNNGILGPGYSASKLVDLRSCKSCHIVFYPQSSSNDKSSIIDSIKELRATIDHKNKATMRLFSVILDMASNGIAELNSSSGKGDLSAAILNSGIVFEKIKSTCGSAMLIFEDSTEKQPPREG